MHLSDHFSYSPLSDNICREKEEMLMYAFHHKDGLGSKSTHDMDTTTDSNYIVSQPRWKPYSATPVSHPLPSIYQFCPFCGKFVEAEEGCFLWESEFVQGWFLCHGECKEDETNFTVYRNQGSLVPSRITAPSRPFSVGSQEYLVSLSLSHPLSTIKYFVTERKINFNGQNLYIPLHNDSFMFQPNLIILPIDDFKIHLKVTPIGESQPTTTSSFSINLRQYHHTELTVQVSQENLTFQASFTKLISKQQKQAALDQLTFKFPHNTSQTLIKFNACTIRLSEWMEEDEEMKGILEKEQEDCTTKSAQQETESFQFMEYLAYLKTHSGSKEFQKKVKTMSSQEIDCIVKNLQPFLTDIILHEYGNYMFQSLISVCNYEQRVLILSTVRKDLSWIVCQQQGTFVFQQFISFITHQEEFDIICAEVVSKFLHLCSDNYANHFLRKLVIAVGEKLLCQLGEQTLHHFVALSNNKNAVCVIKSILRAMKKLSSQQVNKSLKSLINCLSYHIEEVVAGQFGNYLIQELYELFDLAQLSSISETLIKLFPGLSCEKYSSNVLQNCIRKYWTCEKMFWSLKNSLNSKKITMMYRNREGNKILIELMENCPCFPLRERILSTLMNEKPTKFNQHRWLQIRGNRSTGHIETNYSSFSEAVAYKKKCTYNNSMY